MEGPSFDGEHALRALGFMRYYEAWSGHTCHFNSTSLVSAMSSGEQPRRPGASLAMGLAVVAATPLLIGLLWMTGIGAVVGLLLGLVYLLVLLLGGLSGVILMARLGNLRLRSDPDPGLGVMWLAIIVVAVVLAVLFMWRPLGGWVAFLLMLLGVGALSLDTWRRARP